MKPPTEPMKQIQVCLKPNKKPMDYVSASAKPPYLCPLYILYRPPINQKSKSKDMKCVDKEETFRLGAMVPAGQPDYVLPPLDARIDSELNKAQEGGQYDFD
jgi:hypothetical protein